MLEDESDRCTKMRLDLVKSEDVIKGYFDKFIQILTKQKDDAIAANK